MKQKVALTVILTITVTACSSIDSTQELDQHQTLKLTRQVYHLKPTLIKPPGTH